jgi:general secretion pathway protein M
MSEATSAPAGGGAPGGSRQTARQAWAAWQAQWKQLGTRERALVTAAVVVLGLALLWWVGVQPAWQTVRNTPARLDALELRQSAPPPATQAALALKAASERLGAGAKLSVQGDRAVLTLEGVDPGALRSWLAEVRTGARARPLEAQLMQSGPGFSGTVTVVIPASP